MKTIKKLYYNIVKDIAEYYTLFLLIIALPASLGIIFDYKVSIIVSVVIQSIIGILYIRGSK